MKKLLLVILMLCICTSTNAINPMISQSQENQSDSICCDTVVLNIQVPNILLRDSLAKEAQSHLGKRYVWGSNGPNSFDCSGLTSYVYRKFNRYIPRTARSQATVGRKIPLDSAQPGDLIFFRNSRSGNKIGHVGMIITTPDSTGCITFVHAASSRTGIVTQKFPDNKYYSSKFVQIRTIL